MTDIKQELNKLAVKTHDLSKRLYAIENDHALTKNDFMHMRETTSDKFNLIHETMQILDENDRQQLKKFQDLKEEVLRFKEEVSRFKSDTEKMFSEKHAVSKFIQNMLKLWPFWISIFLFLVYLDAHKFAANLLNFR